MGNTSLPSRPVNCNASLTASLAQLNIFLYCVDIVYYIIFYIVSQTISEEVQRLEVELSKQETLYHTLENERNKANETVERLTRTQNSMKVKEKKQAEIVKELERDIEAKNTLVSQLRYGSLSIRKETTTLQYCTLPKVH